VRAEARRIADALASVPGVDAIVMGGSRARGRAHADSDIDLGIYYHRDRPPDNAALRAVAARLDDRGEVGTVTEPGAWGPWINGGAWLRIGGRKVDWLYREIEQVDRSIDDAVAGRVRLHYQPGHPFAFGESIFAGEVHYCEPLHDPAGTVARLKRRTDPYPPELRQALISTLWEADFSLDIAQTAAGRGDGLYVAGCLFRCAMVVLQVVFAINERYWVNEKGALEEAASFPLAPHGLVQTVQHALGSSGMEPTTLAASIEQMRGLVESVRRLPANNREA
jgi:hypothetical protein